MGKFKKIPGSNYYYFSRLTPKIKKGWGYNSTNGLKVILFSSASLTSEKLEFQQTHCCGISLKQNFCSGVFFQNLRKY